MRLTLTEAVTLSEGVQLRRYPQGHLVCAFGTSQAFEVDGVGALILYNVDSPVQVAELLRMATEAFDEPAEELQEDLVGFIADCLEMGILRLS